MIKAAHVVSFAIALLAAPVASADECYDAVLNYNHFLGEVLDAMQAYSTCIADSKGMDRCDKPFAKLQEAHKQFAAAVSLYIKQCR